MKKKLIYALLFVTNVIVVSGFFVPKSNPPIENTVAWDSSETRDQFMKSCADCHSHETKWPWYSYIGPSSFLAWNNVKEGREHFNISVPNMGDFDECAEEVMEGEMPARDYLLLHGDAKLNETQKNAFTKGLIATFGEKSHDERHHNKHN
jgi:hypothetical protein